MQKIKNGPNFILSATAPETMVQHVAATNGDLAVAAWNFGLVDDLLTRNEVRDYMIDQVGKSATRKVGRKEDLK